MTKTLRKTLSLFLVFAILVSLSAALVVQAAPDDAGIPAGNEYARRPFPQHEQYAMEMGRPSNKTQDVMDDMTLTMFKRILNNNLIRCNGTFNYAGKAANTFTETPTRENFKLISYHSGETAAVTVSETQGYFMLELAYMAGCEEALTSGSNAHTFIMGCESIQEYYDAALRTVQWCPSNMSNSSSGNPNLLMCWQITSTASGSGSVQGSGSNRTCAFNIRSADADCATDGDMDIIHSLIVADQQWGSDGRYNYKQIAINMLKSFWGYCTHPTYRYLLLADWAYGTSTGVTGYQRASRPSDWMIDHLRAYQAIDTDPTHNWQLVIDATLRAMADIREEQNAMGGARRDNGLLSDFIERYDTARPSVFRTPLTTVLEGAGDVRYQSNSCRIPWRLGTDYLLYGDTPPITSNGGISSGRTLYTYCVEKLDWLARMTTGNGNVNGGNFSNGTSGQCLGAYNMDGSSRSNGAAEFKAPFLVTAAAVNHNQAWVDSAWSYPQLASQTASSGWNEHLTFFPLLVASGNYWNVLQPKPDAPENLEFDGTDLTWDAVAPPTFAYQIGGYRVYQNDALVATTSDTAFAPASADEGDVFKVVAFVAEDNVSDAATLEWEGDVLAWPFTALEWVLFKMAHIDIDKYGYDQYDDVIVVLRALQAPSGTSNVSYETNPAPLFSNTNFPAAQRNMFLVAGGQYYDLYQTLRDQEAEMVRLWLEDYANPRPGEHWQDHWSRLQQLEYNFIDTPGVYRLVEAGRRVSVLGSNTLYNNADYIKTMAWDALYAAKFTTECYTPAKAVEKQIDYMDPTDPVAVAAAKAAFESLDNLSKSCVMNYEKVTRALGLVYADGSDKLPDNIKYVGMRKPPGADTDFTNLYHQAALSDLQAALPGANPFYIWIAGNSSGSMRIGTTSWDTVEASGSLKYPREYYTQLGVTLSTDTIQDAFFAYLDANFPDAEVYVQVENMARIIEPQLDVLSYLSRRYECVKGFAIDLEWYNFSTTDCGIKMSDYRAKKLNEDIYKHWGSDCSLTLKHYDTVHMPNTYRGGTDGKSNPIIFVSDSQGYGSFDGSHGGKYSHGDTGNGMTPGNGGDWALLAQYVYPNPVVFQTGYADDSQWLYSFEDQQVRGYGIKLANVLPADQTTGIAWVNFDRNDPRVFPNQTWRTLTQQVSDLATRSIAYLSNFPAGGTSAGGDSRLIGGLWGFFSGTGSRKNNDVTYFDAMFARNVRQTLNGLIAKGAPAAGFTGHTNYGRFLGVEVRSFDFMVAHRYDIIKNGGGYIAERDRDIILMLYDMYQGLSSTAACTFPTGTSAVPGYTNGAIQKQAVTKLAEYKELLRLSRFITPNLSTITVRRGATATIAIDKNFAAAVEFTSAVPMFATVSASGVVTGVAVGISVVRITDPESGLTVNVAVNVVN